MELDPDVYFLEVRPVGFFWDTTEGVACESVTLELAVAPVQVVQDRLRLFGCPTETLLPGVLDQMDFFLNQGQPFVLDTATLEGNHAKFNIRLPPNATGSKTMIRGYPLLLTPRPGTSPLFRVSASLGYEFLIGGSARLLLVPASPDGAAPECFIVRPLLSSAFLPDLRLKVRRGVQVRNEPRVKRAHPGHGAGAGQLHALDLRPGAQALCFPRRLPPSLTSHRD